MLATYPSARVSWDYGWGVPVRNSAAHVLEVHDLAPLIPGLIGRVSGQVSFVLLLAARETELGEVVATIENVQREEDWESRVLDKIALLGFSHEGNWYSIKARQAHVLDFLATLAGSEQILPK